MQLKLLHPLSTETTQVVVGNITCLFSLEFFSIISQMNVLFCLTRYTPSLTVYFGSSVIIMSRDASRVSLVDKKETETSAKQGWRK